MSLFQRIPDLASPARTYSPLFNFVDDHSHRAHSTPNHNQPKLSSSRSSDFNPTFDVRESKEAYELHGELPGVEKSDVKIEFTSQNTLTIVGNKERQYIAAIDENNEICTSPSDDQYWPQLNGLTESIDAATTGPVKGRRTSLVDSSQWQRPSENIDSWSHMPTSERAKRRPSVVNARTWEHPVENIDAWSHTHRQAERKRRPSIVNAKAWQQPAENIDASTAVHHAERARRRPSIVNASTRAQPAENIDAATSGPLRVASMNATNGVARPRTASKSKYSSQQQPWLLTERPFGTFWREFKFPDAVDRDAVKASLKEGVLTVVVPKKTVSPDDKKVIVLE